MMPGRVRRSARISSRLDGIDQKLLHLLEVSRSLNAAETDLSVRLETFMGCHDQVVEIMASVRAEIDRYPPENARKKEFGPIIEMFNELIAWVSKEAEDIVKIIGQVATYTRPANLGRRPGTCAICQDPEAFKRSGRAAMGKCGTPRAKHVFCGACFTAWFIQAGESSCPMCRHDYSKDFRDL